MKPWLGVVLLGASTMVLAARGEEAFSRSIRPEDFNAAELDKLSPAALAKLDALVQGYKTGAVETARAEANADAERRVATKQREMAEAKPDSPGFFAKAKVMLSPGTKVEYGEIESSIAGKFSGWEPKTVFRLENGQMWRVANGDSYTMPTVNSPKVRIYPASMGGFWLKVDGVNQRVKVLPL